MAQARRKERQVETAAEGGEAPPARERRGFAGMSARGWAVLAGVVLVINFPLLHHALRGAPDAHVALPYRQDFSDPGVVARDFFSIGGYWRTVDGKLFSPGVKNNPLWLEAALPADVAVEFDARSDSRQGDIKVELFGDGRTHASGYVLIHGGWNNTVSVIARLDEHGPSLATLRGRAQRALGHAPQGTRELVQAGVLGEDTRLRVEASPFPVEPGRTYRWRIERRGTLLRWLIDGRPFLELDDPFPLKGKGHDRFGFSSWEALLSFDNLVVQPL